MARERARARPAWRNCNVISANVNAIIANANTDMLSKPARGSISRAGFDSMSVLAFAMMAL
eukprot:8828992-Lingulodinium_polyedra.AAC.1